MLGTESAVKTQLGTVPKPELNAGRDTGVDGLLFAVRWFKSKSEAVVKITDSSDGIPPEAKDILKVHSQRSSARQFSTFLNTLIVWLEGPETKTFEIDTSLEHRIFRIGLE